MNSTNFNLFVQIKGNWIHYFYFFKFKFLLGLGGTIAVTGSGRQKKRSYATDHEWDPLTK